MTAELGSRPVPEGASARITERQDQPEHLQRLLAYSRCYQVAQRWHRARALGTFALAAVGPILSLLIPSASELIAAISAGWLVVGRTGLTYLERRCTIDAVRMHELYDTKLFYLPWNGSLVGRQPAPDDIAEAARGIKDGDRYKVWYSIDLGDTPWPADVLLCQRQSMVWGRSDHRAYGTTVFVMGFGWLIVGIVFALAADLSLADYLVKIFLPTSPALLDSVEVARSHWQTAIGRQQVEERIHDLWLDYKANRTDVTEGACREIQNSAYVLRRDTQRVPDLFYRHRRTRVDHKTRAGTDSLLAEED